MSVHLVKPSRDLLPSYLEAIEEGSFCNMALGGHGDADAAEIRKNQEAYLASICDRAPRAVEVAGGTLRYTLTDHEFLWITDGKRFIGTLSLRYAGDKEIVEEYGGHVGMAIRPSLLNIGYGVRAAQEAWQLVYPLFLEKGINKIVVSCNPTNRGSKRLIEHNGGQLIKSNEDAFGTGPNLLYMIDLAAGKSV